MSKNIHLRQNDKKWSTPNVETFVFLKRQTSSTLFVIHQASISPNFFCQAKSRWRKAFGKKMLFNFTKHNNSEFQAKIGTLFAEFGYCLQNPMLQKSVLILFARKSHASMFMKSTPGVNFTNILLQCVNAPADIVLC